LLTPDEDLWPVQPKVKVSGIKFLCRCDFSGGGEVDWNFLTCKKPLISLKMVVMGKKFTGNLRKHILRISLLFGSFLKE
jgi:hypothetical protein